VTTPALVLHATELRLAICRYAPDASLPGIAQLRGTTFWSITRTPDELSIVCDEDRVPKGDVQVENGWAAFSVQGPLPFGLTGVISGITAPLAEAGVPVFVVSTYLTDWLLVKHTDFARARAILAERFEVR
jgi:hypothetical protein